MVEEGGTSFVGMPEVKRDVLRPLEHGQIDSSKIFLNQGNDRLLGLQRPANLFEPAWDPRRLHTLEARMESWQRSAPQQRGTHLS